MGFKRAQGNAHCVKFESHTNRVTFETNAIRMTSSVQAPNHPIYSHTKTLWDEEILHKGPYTTTPTLPPPIQSQGGQYKFHIYFTI